jgi:hypothetical protein
MLAQGDVMSRVVSFALIAAGIGGLLLALAYFVQWSPVDELWPWSGMETTETTIAGPPGSPFAYGASTSSGDSGGLPNLSYYFLSSIFAAIALPVVWIGLTREVAATVGGAINLTVMYTALSIYMLQSYTATDHTRLLIAGLVCAASAAVSVGLFFWARRFSFRDQRPMPGPVRWSFGLFVVTLILVGGALILKRPNVFPWPLEAEVSVVYGWIFLSAAAYFIYALWVPLWHNACGPLLGFLAYDLVLIVPFLDYFDTVDSVQRPRLIVYTLVVSFSGLLAIFYLFLNPATRIWFARPQAAVQPA